MGSSSRLMVWAERSTTRRGRRQDIGRQEIDRQEEDRKQKNIIIKEGITLGVCHLVLLLLLILFCALGEEDRPKPLARLARLQGKLRADRKLSRDSWISPQLRETFSSTATLQTFKNSTRFWLPNIA